MPRRVLVIEDNLDIARLLKLHLRELGCDVRDAQDGLAGLSSGLALIIVRLKAASSSHSGQPNLAQARRELASDSSWSRCS